MTSDQLHLAILSWQPKWFKNLPLPLRELPAGLLMLPLLWGMGSWWVLALPAFLLGSYAYEKAFSYKADDALWRAHGAVAVNVVWYYLQ